MGKYQSKIVAALGMMALGLVACELEQEVPIPEHEPKLTMRLALTNTIPDTIHYASGEYNQLYIGRSKGIFDSSQELGGVTNATVTLYNEAGQAVESYTHSGKLSHNYYEIQQIPGYYHAEKEYVPQPGKAYTLRASAPGFQPVEATVHMPNPNVITEAALTDVVAAEYNMMTLEGRLRVTFEDNQRDENYYRIVAYPLDSAQTRLPYLTLYPQLDRSNPELGMEQQLGLGGLFSDALYKSGQITLVNRVSIPALDGGYMMRTGKKRYTQFVEVQVQQLTRDEYLFYQTMRAQWDTDGNPFAEYAQVHRNVQNGYGVLGGVTISRQIIPLN
jgi:hypothetical protein